MQGMIDQIPNEESGDVQRSKEYGQQRESPIRNNSSFMHKDWREDGSGGGVTPWRSRMTRARNTIEATANIAPLLEGI